MQQRWFVLLCCALARAASSFKLVSGDCHIDHTLLKPDATVEEVDRLCAEAMEHGFASVCVNSGWVRRCAEILGGSGVLVCTVVGFPLGACLTEVKSYEARRAIEHGACEVDMVLNVGAMKSGMEDTAVLSVPAALEPPPMSSSLFVSSLLWRSNMTINSSSQLLSCWATWRSCLLIQCDHLPIST